MNEYTVSELTSNLKSLLELKFSNLIKVSGELSSIKQSNNNVYITLKDSLSSISVIFWNNSNFNFNKGDQVEIKCKLTYFTKSGYINLIGKSIQVVGIGKLYEEYQKNFKIFKDLGYFNFKKDLPKNISNIGILTAKDGAALQDILYVFNQHNFTGNILVYNCYVQGNKCPQSIIEGIEYFEQNNNIDVLLITRGGGSFEDLIGFSDKNVIEKIYQTKLFTISAIGHEVDNMISDDVSNYRAPTPSIAAENISSKYNESLIFLEEIENSINNSIFNDIKFLQEKIIYLNTVKEQLPDCKNIISKKFTELEEIEQEYFEKMNNYITNFENIITEYQYKLKNNTHDSILKKGYVLFLNNSGKIINNFENNSTQKLKLITSNKELNVTININ